MENKEKETVKVSEETKETKTEKPKLFKKPKANPYKKHDDASDPEIEAFAKGELEKFHREKKEKAETATVQRTLKHQKKLQAQMVKQLLQLNALKMPKNVSLRNVMTI